ncbi:L,D-transpeptidase family protein [Phragmitibacter flavus]|uniref:L,D-transpeptidase family protein n=1 Tax=Phragmitibacter flavus TaxID=2576071 RepID=UPI001F0F7AAE|nr:L,D-transpeptidase family protein [Phragmitibacter flavus]
MKNLFWMSFLAVALFAWSYRREVSPPCLTCIPMPEFEFRPEMLDSLPKHPLPPEPGAWQSLEPEQRLKDVHERVKPVLATELEAEGSSLGTPVFLRVFKESREMELWMKVSSDWTRFRNYRIAAMSGELGPKLKEGDRQAPEGFYAVRASALNPRSAFHLSFDIGYPNAYDRFHDRTGTHIMVHGNEVSLGCFAMTDPMVEEIYLLVSEALKAGQKEVPVHVFPFRMTEQRMLAAGGHSSREFWENLREGYELFDRDREVPVMGVKDGRYVVEK